MVSSVLALAVGFAGMAFAMSSTNYTSLYTVDPGTVATATLMTWCNSQQTSCLDICNYMTTANTCTYSTLAWECTCSAFTTPNISSYQQTVPYFECTQYVANCQVANTANAAAQQACLAIDCAPNDPSTLLAVYSSSAAAGSATTSSAKSTSTSTSVATVSATTTTGTAVVASSASTTATAAATSSTTTSGTGAALSWAKTYGLGLFGAGAFALFGFAL